MSDVDRSNDREISKAFLTCFTRDLQAGAVVLSTFAEWCGLHTPDPELIKPELVALYFRIMLMLGIKGTGAIRDLKNPQDFQDYINETSITLRAARGLVPPVPEEAPDAGSDNDQFDDDFPRSF